METLLIKKIRGGIIGIKNGSKSPSEISLGSALNRLKEINEGQYEEYMLKYKEALKIYQEKFADNK